MSPCVCVAIIDPEQAQAAYMPLRHAVVTFECFHSTHTLIKKYHTNVIGHDIREAGFLQGFFRLRLPDVIRV